MFTANPSRNLASVSTCVCVCVCSHLCSQLVVEQFESSHSLIQLFGLLSLLLLDDLSACFYHRLHLPFHFTQHLVQLLLDTSRQQRVNIESTHT